MNRTLIFISIALTLLAVCHAGPDLVIADAVAQRIAGKGLELSLLLGRGKLFGG